MNIVFYVLFYLLVVPYYYLNVTLFNEYYKEMNKYTNQNTNSLSISIIVLQAGINIFKLNFFFNFEQDCSLVFFLLREKEWGVVARDKDTLERLADPYHGAV